MARYNIEDIKKNKNNNVQEITKSFFSSETLGEETKKETSATDPKEKKQYSKRYTIKNKEEKSENINIRLTKSEFNELMAKVEKSGLGSTSNYIRELIKRGK